MSSLPGVAEFYAEKNVFITGATGFLGKVLLERLLYQCDQINKIYLLTRPKKNVQPKERLISLFDSPLYDKLKEKYGGLDAILSHLVIIQGDIEEVDLGISPQDRKLLCDNVDVIFHSAATVRFDEQMRKAIILNIRAVRDMITLASQCSHLQAFVHVSTAYANCDRETISEHIYPPPHDPIKVMELADWLDAETLDALQPSLIKNKPNTYTFTKHCAEVYVRDHTTVPTAIFRPSIIGAVWRDPLPGWIDNYNGPSGVYVAYGKGLLRKFYCDMYKVADMVPVDVVVNQMILIGWNTAVLKPTQVSVYNCCAANNNQLTWGQMSPVVINTFTRTPMEACFRRPKCSFVPNLFVYKMWSFLEHSIPAYTFDTFLRVIGQRARMVKIYSQIDRMVYTLSFFTTREWHWVQDNFSTVRCRLTEEERHKFISDNGPLCWPEYIESYCLGSKKYLLGEDLNELEGAHMRLRQLAAVRLVFNSGLIVFLWRVFVARSRLGRAVWRFILDLVGKIMRKSPLRAVTAP